MRDIWQEKIRAHRQRQAGAVSLFVVIFAALLITVVTVSFVQLMVKDQQQATTSDLSQSAYDSALAGVEDAKRLLLLDQACRNNAAPSTVNCSAIEGALAPTPGQPETECDTLASSGLVGETNGETIIEQSESDGAARLDQAYTCVKIALDTDDYKGNLEVGSSGIVPIVGAGAFDTVELSWFSRDDVPGSSNNPAVGFPSSGANVDLPRVGSRWRANYPALMRVEFMQTGTSFTLNDFNDSQSGNRSNANTLFLYPSQTGLVEKDFALDARRSGSVAPQQIRCNSSFVDGEYACTVTLRLPNPINGGSADRNAYLRLTSLYNGAHYSLKLKNGNQDVQFNRVQPVVDATGRANDVFRRVQARIELRGDFTYPEAAIDMQGNLCKNFTVTDRPEGYSASGTCDPAS